MSLPRGQYLFNNEYQWLLKSCEQTGKLFLHPVAPSDFDCVRGTIFTQIQGKFVSVGVFFNPFNWERCSEGNPHLRFKYWYGAVGCCSSGPRSRAAMCTFPGLELGCLVQGGHGKGGGSIGETMHGRGHVVGEVWGRLHSGGGRGRRRAQGRSTQQQRRCCSSISGPVLGPRSQLPAPG